MSARDCQSMKTVNGFGAGGMGRGGENCENLETEINGFVNFNVANVTRG